MSKSEKIGIWTIRNPELVIKLGVVYDSYKFSFRDKLWAEAEKKAREQQMKITEEHFYEELHGDNKVTYEFRWYTPESNRYVTGEK